MVRAVLLGASSLFVLALPIIVDHAPPVSEPRLRVTRADVNRFVSNSTCKATPKLHASCVAAFASATERLGAPELAWRDGDVEAALSRVFAAAQERHVFSDSFLLSMINAQLAIFDPHARLELRETLTSRLSGDVRTGFGFDQEITRAGVRIKRVHPGTPAERAGMRAGDILVAVNANPLGRGETAIAHLKTLEFKPDVSAQFALNRNGKSIQLTIHPEPLAIPDVNIATEQAGLVRAQIRFFSRGVCQALHTRLAQLQPREVIIDLRGNPGGAVYEAECVHGLFSSARPMIRRHHFAPVLPDEFNLNLDFNIMQSSAPWPKAPAVLPSTSLVVLVDASTASAAEMLAGAWQDEGRAWIVGERTFGKGSTQGQSEQAFNPNLRLIYSISRYDRPSGRPVQLVGVIPNLVVPFRASATAAERDVPRERDVFGVGPFTLAAIRAWRDPRASQIKQLGTCARVRSRGADTDDHQLQMARELLRCRPSMLLTAT